jgi:hypothetical protein
MILVSSPDSSEDPMLSPWIRVLRREATKDDRGGLGTRFVVIEFVHAAFFQQYITEQVLPMMDEFGRRAIALNEALRYEAVVEDLANWTWSDVRPQPRPAVRR